MDDIAASGAAGEVARELAAGHINRRDALRRLGLLGLGAVGASAFLDAHSSSAAAGGAPEVFRILSFCGGGIRGLISAGALARLAARFPNIVSDADLLAGCSVGSTIVSSLLANQTPEQIYEAAVNETPKFYANPGTDPQKPAFDTDLIIASQLKLHPDNPKLSDLHKKVFIPSFNVGSANTPWGSILFNNLAGSTNADTHLVDAVVSSSVMPSEEGSHKGNVDGAFVFHDPTLAAIALAVNAGVRLEDIVAICFGTGFMANWIASDTSEWGAQQWQNGDGNPANRLPTMLINGTLSPVLDMASNGTSTNLIPELSAMMLPGRYSYLNPTLNRLIPEWDTNPTDLEYLQNRTASLDLNPAKRLLRKYW